jgi:phenylpropionate dioxygenase-like ring-hydroxylating dioxygenase large terminal subunit
MTNEPHVALVRKLIARLDEPPGGPFVGRVPSDRYRDAARFAKERAAIFRRLPAIVAHEEEIPRGTVLAVDIDGVPVVLTRADDGEVRAFRNACRHRATCLVPDGPACAKKAIVCPYHGWTYDLRGARIHVPLASTFRGEDATRDALVPAYATLRDGLVWASLTSFDLEDHLGGLADDLAALDLSAMTVYRRTTRDVRGNWKLVIDAFLDGYHIRQLHRDTVYRFFLDGRVESERVGRHLRSVVGRRALLDARRLVLESPEKLALCLRELVTPACFVFPSTHVVIHPDFVSILAASPTAIDRTRFVHTMLVPAAQRESKEEHWEKSAVLIDEGVFAREDLGIVEAVQRGLDAETDDSALCSDLEHGLVWFHEAVDAIVDP